MIDVRLLTALAVSPADRGMSTVLYLSGFAVAVGVLALLQRRAMQLASRDREGQAILDTFFETAPLGVCLLDRDLRFVRVNDTYASWSNTTPADHVGKGVDDLQPGIREQIEAPLRRLLVTGEPLVGFETIQRDRHYRASHYPIRDARGDITMIAAIIDDVTSSRETEARLEQLLVQEQAARFELERARWKLTAQNRQLATQATTDSLTKLANRGAFEERLAEAVAHARRGNTCVGVLYIDLDGFKAVNDRYGHAAGDQLLSVLARRLTTHRRANDLIARVGGDEFLVLLPDLEIDDAQATVDSVATRIREAIAAPVTLANGEVRVSSSVGTSLYPTDAATAADLVAVADTAMYRSKRAA